MSLSGALSNALSGLTAASQNAQVTASNLANIMTEGYARRELELGARALGSYGGVRVAGITRHANPGLIAERRTAASQQAGNSSLAVYFSRLETLVGTPADGSSLSARLANFETSLVSAASRPDLAGRLNQVFSDAQALTQTFENISDGIQTMRSEADREIATTVEQLNTALSQVRTLNTRISEATILGNDTSALQDQRQLLIDTIAEIVPVNEVPRDLGAVALYTSGGAILLDGNAVELTFTATNMIVPGMSNSGGLLSGIDINGVEISTNPDSGPLRGGRLSALFEIRDNYAVEAQSQLDSIARDLVERFQDAGLDATRAPGAAGLFTDGGAAYAAADEVGLSSRLTINAAVDPNVGGATWRLRDGLGAVTPGAAGNSTLLQNMQGVLTTLRAPASGSFGPAAQTAANLQASFLAEIGAARENNDQKVSFSAARYDSANSQLLENGVDSDQEMQRLILIEQTYAANARIMEVIDEMMEALMRI